MPLFFAGTSSAHVQELGIARILTSDSLHQRGQQFVKTIDRFIPVRDLALAHHVSPLLEDSLVEQATGGSARHASL